MHEIICRNRFLCATFFFFLFQFVNAGNVVSLSGCSVVSPLLLYDATINYIGAGADMLHSNLLFYAYSRFYSQIGTTKSDVFRRVRFASARFSKLGVVSAGEKVLKIDSSAVYYCVPSNKICGIWRWLIHV